VANLDWLSFIWLQVVTCSRKSLTPNGQKIFHCYKEGVCAFKQLAICPHGKDDSCCIFPG
jgi:hypothetical protein